MKWMFAFFVSFILYGCADFQSQPDTRWQTLFDGESLDGWHIVNGDVPFTVENGEIIGKTAAGIPTRYLATNKQYTDFILELEMNNSEGENSGIQFRSVKAPQFRAGLTGYQLEVDPSARAWTGGIFFEGMGEWRHAPIGNEKCKRAWNKTAWNSLRIEAKGALMRTFVNDVSCAYLYDETLDSGYIALQIHSIGAMPGRAEAPTRWRNIRIIENPTDDDYTESDNNLQSLSYLPNQLSPHEEANGWTLLGPHNIGEMDWARTKVANPVTNTVAEVDILKVDASHGDRQMFLPHIKAKYELIADVQMLPGTKGVLNYPIMSKTNDDRKIECLSSFAIFDDTSIDYKKSKAKYLMGSVTGKLTAKNLSEGNRRKRVLAPQRWQRIKIVVDGQHVEHWFNAVKVADYMACNTQESPPLGSDAVKINIDAAALTLRNMRYRAL
jgi:hypothetical protein